MDTNMGCRQTMVGSKKGTTANHSYWARFRTNLVPQTANKKWALTHIFWAQQRGATTW